MCHKFQKFKQLLLEQFLYSLFGTARQLRSRYVPSVCSPQEKDQSLLMEAFIANASGRQNKI